MPHFFPNGHLTPCHTVSYCLQYISSTHCQCAVDGSPRCQTIRPLIATNTCMCRTAYSYNLLSSLQPQSPFPHSLSLKPLILVRIWATNNSSPHSSVLGHPFQLTPGVSSLCGVSL
ncbi:hypothetical protein BsWGS_25869 [Bradybaena similaris]